MCVFFKNGEANTMSHNIDFLTLEDYTKHIQEYVKKNHPENYPLTYTQLKSMWKRQQERDLEYIY